LGSSQLKDQLGNGHQHVSQQNSVTDGTEKKHMDVTNPMENTLYCFPKAALAIDSKESLPGEIWCGDTGDKILAEYTRIESGGGCHNQRNLCRPHETVAGLLKGHW
jgi:hypothetical protein